MLNHIYYVKTTVPTWAEQSKAKPPKQIKVAASTDTAIHRQYAHLLFYKHFVDLAQPLIVCEGKTDGLYLKFANYA